jgi:EAL domain-containing protein (putative c-di-GMP-specific phosphodiesterase class I)
MPSGAGRVDLLPPLNHKSARRIRKIRAKVVKPGGLCRHQVGVESSRSGRAICKALIELAIGLDIEVLAEGVETAEEVQQLRSQGCRLFQGFYFGRPMPQAAFHDMVRAAPEAEVVA